MRTALLALLSLFAVAPAAAAQEREAAELPASLSSAVSASNLEHTLRVVVFSSGFEHVASRVYLQWLVPDRDADSGSRVVSSRMVEEVSGGLFSVGQPAVMREGDHFRVVLEATNSHTLENETFVFFAKKPGVYRAAK